jgi:hypothetical protein
MDLVCMQVRVVIKEINQTDAVDLFFCINMSVRLIICTGQSVQFVRLRSFRPVGFVVHVVNIAKVRIRMID